LGTETITVNITQTSNTVSGPIHGEASEKDFSGEVGGTVRGWMLDGRLQGKKQGTGRQSPIEVHIRWTLLNQESRQFQAVGYITAQSDERLAILLDPMCGARRGSPMPEPCREPTGTVLDHFQVEGKQVATWNSLNAAASREAQVFGDFRATIALTAKTTRQGDLVGFGVTDLRDTTAITVMKGFASDANPQAMVAVVGKRNDFAMSAPSSYTADTVHFRIERRGRRFAFAFSADGKTWSPIQHDFGFADDAILDPVKVFVVAVTNTANSPIVAEGSGLAVTPP
jgi:hypothetical protein